MAVAMSFVPTAAVGDRCRDVARVDWTTSSGALPGTCWPLPGRIWTLLDAGAGVGDGTRHVADVFCRVAGHLLAVTRS